MRIVVGVCGLGRGHSARQTRVVRWLLHRGHRVELFAYGQSARIFADTFPDIMCHTVQPPIVESGALGVDFAATAAHHLTDCTTLHNNYQCMAAAVKALGGPPNLVITDYEPVSAQLAYAYDAPLITIDNQSRFLGFNYPSIRTLSCIEERSRLSLYFPKALLRIAVSCFPVMHDRNPSFDVTIVPSFTRFAAKNPLPSSRSASLPHLLVYLSPYSRATFSLKCLCDELSTVRCTATVFSELAGSGFSRGNVSCRPFGATFEAELYNADGVIANAGHNIISEALFLGKPLMVVPFETYEQQANALALSTAGLGVARSVLNREAAAHFIRMLPVIGERLAHATSRSDVHVESRDDPTVLQLLSAVAGL